MVNAQPRTMAGIIDYGVGIATKSSPGCQAIEKAQEELRNKCHVREERRRELEFLEKGGNPLDFDFAHVATASAPSTSLTNQRPGQNLISEAKSSFAASPHGDSLESNDRLGSSLCHETNTADGGSKSDIIKDKVIKRETKRLNAAQPKQSLSTDSNKSVRKTEDSGLSHLVVKSQAYVRRNRSKPSRDSASVSLIRSSVNPAKGSEPRDKNGVAQRKIADGPVSNVKPTGSYDDNAPKNTASDDQATMELDGFQNVRESDCVVKNESKAEELPSVETSGANTNVSMRQCDSSASTHDERESRSGHEKADDSNLDKCVGHIHVDKLDKKRVVPACAMEDPGTNKNDVDPLCEGTKVIIDGHLAVDINLVAMKVDGKSHDDLNNNRYSNKTLKENGQTEGLTKPTSVEAKMDNVQVQPESSSTCLVKDVMEVSDSAIVALKSTGCLSSGYSMNIEGKPASYRKNDNCLSDPISACSTAVGTDLLKNYVPDAVASLKSAEPNMENGIKKSKNPDKMATKVYEDSVLRNARIIGASIKRAGERLLCNTSLEKRRKSHWDFVLEEMAWMANDFMQERLWKNVAGAQMCRWIASNGRAKFEEASIQRNQKMIMKSLAKSIMSFWRSAEASQNARRTAMMQEQNSTVLETKVSGIKAYKEHGNKSLGARESLQSRQLKIQDYAVRFLEYNGRTADSLVLAEAPPTPDRLNDSGILKMSDQLSEESLFYTVPTGAMMAYRESVESLFEYHKRACNNELMDECEASVCDSAAEFPDTYEGVEGATEAYEDGFISKIFDKKKYQMHQSISGARQYEIGTYVPYEPCLESKSGNRPLLLNGKRSSFLAVPAKRSRAAARQHVGSPFHASATATGAAHITSKADALSGDTNSIQDDESSLHGGSLQWKNMDYESTVDFDRQLPYDDGEVATKVNKKKKINNPGYKAAQNSANSIAPASNHMWERRLQVEDYLKKRSDGHQYNSNEIYGANGVQHASKKLKKMKQDNSPEASRFASQMSNMANRSRFIKIIANRERGRKCKALKTTSSDGWSCFEDQALVVLVHDMGQNWELICDAINSIVQFKSVRRQPNECKERHKVLVDRSSGDGADSAEDSGSSQRCHNSLPCIPKGSARQLFERLQGPFEEENLKEHFEKIILLMQKVHSRHRQGNRRELKPIMQPHSSHVIALSQVFVNKLPGVCLTPLDLCDPVSLNLDSMTPGSLSLGSRTNGLTMPNHQSFAGPATPPSNLASRLPGAHGMVVGNTLLSSSTWNSHRDAQKYSVPRQGDEQPKAQYNQVVSGRNFQQPAGLVPGVFPTGTDHDGRTMPVAQMALLNRVTPVAKAGIPRISDSEGLAVSPGNLVPNSGQGLPGPVNSHPRGISGSGNSIPRSHDPAQILHPGYSMEEHKVPDMHTQITQGSKHNVSVSCINTSFSNVAVSPPVQQPKQPQMSQSSHMFGNPDHSQIQEAGASPQQREYALHLPKERQTQQHMVPQQNSDIYGASAVSHVQSGSHIVKQNQRSAVDGVPCLQPQHQRQHDAQNPPDSSSSPNLPTTAALQKQKKQQGQQKSRQNLQQRNQGSQQARLMKSLGRGNMVIPQTPPVDDMPANAVSTPSKKHMPDKKLMQHGQEFPPANTAPMPSMLQPMNQPKLCTVLPQPLKQLPDIGNQSGMQASWTKTLSDSQQSLVQDKSTLTTQQQQQQIIPSQNNIQRTNMQQNSQMSSECRTDTHPKQVLHNHMVPATSVPLSTDSSSSLLSSINQPKHEASHNPASLNSSSNMLSSPSNTSFGNETLLSSSGQDVLKRQISGGLPMQSQVVGQWNQQASQQLQSQHQHTPIVQGSVYAPSNSGSG